MKLSEMIPDTDNTDSKRVEYQYCEIKQQRRLFVSADVYCQNLNNQNKCSNEVL
jgi:hypothetical protein